MGIQRFVARDPYRFANGAIGWSPGGPMDCLGPYAKVQNCPIQGTNLRVTAYATGYPYTYFSIPAGCKVRGCYVGGFLTSVLTSDGNDIEFVPYDRFKDRLITFSVAERKPQ